MRELVVLSEDELEQLGEDERHRDLGNDYGKCVKAIDKVKKGIEKQAQLSPDLLGMKDYFTHECVISFA